MAALFQQFGRIWKNLGTNQRISIVLSMMGVVAGMVGLLVWSARPSLQLLYGQLDPKDMAAVITAVEERDVTYRIGAGGSSISVPRSEVYALRMDLASKGVPSGGGVGFEIFDRGNFGISDFVQRTNYLRALQGELGRTISQLHGVRSARVMVVVPENKLLKTNENDRPTASVFVDTGGGQLPTESVNSIRFLVANAVEGLVIDDVAVIDNHGNTLSEDLRLNDFAGGASSQFKYRKSLEEYFAKKVEGMLGKVVGAGNVVARVSVEVDPEAATVLEERYDPDSQVARTETQIEDSTISNQSKPQQSVGVTANAPEGGASTGGTGGGDALSSSQEVRKNRTVSYEINRSTIERVKTPGRIDRISAAVFLAMRMKEGEAEGELEPNPRSDEELASLRDMVFNALGVEFSAGSTAQQQITVEEAVFEGMAPVAEETFFLFQDNMMPWFDLIRSFLPVGIAIFMFTIFLRMVKRHQPTPGHVEIMPDTPNEALGPAPELNREITPDMLNSLIKEKPDNISAALKTWAGSGAEN